LGIQKIYHKSGFTHWKNFPNNNAKQILMGYLNTNIILDMTRNLHRAFSSSSYSTYFQVIRTSGLNRRSRQRGAEGNKGEER
jgi:hypothetical protein